MPALTLRVLWGFVVKGGGASASGGHHGGGSRRAFLGCFGDLRVAGFKGAGSASVGGARKCGEGGGGMVWVGWGLITEGGWRKLRGRWGHWRDANATVGGRAMGDIWGLGGLPNGGIWISITVLLWKVYVRDFAAGVYIYAVEDIRVDERSGFGVDGGGVGHGAGGG